MSMRSGRARANTTTPVAAKTSSASSSDTAGLSSDRGQMRLATRAGLTTRTVPSNSRSPKGRTVTLATRRRPCRPTSSKARLRVASNGNRTSPWASAYTPIRLSPTLPAETVFMRSSPPQGGGSLGPGRLRSSRGRTRTCDPLTPNGHDRVLGRRKIRDWRAENPEETSETHPKRTCPTVPNRTARNEARRVNSTAPRQTAYNFHSPLTGGSLHRAGCIGNMTLERRQGVGLLYIVCLMTPRTPQADLKLSRCSVRQDARAHPHDTRRLAGARSTAPPAGPTD